ncbi:hypothetical protein CC86DRAFT_469369 [Ophiobolus disseminans]|uniref:Uncharacterized protein n=1 Tax=Ophiobolus disseminans TaxID=1469910 RepID=A0A6A6ZSK8_9PLEO|nr:hypothetical protein CC86DRAFT_469369 [Ophiobolus disseminans]
MSTTTVTQPPAAKKRGRPKKVVPGDAGVIAAEQGKSAATKTAGKAAAVMDKAKTVPARTTKSSSVAKKDAPKPAATTRPAPPPTPETSPLSNKAQATATKPAQKDSAAQITSPILDKVRARGTLHIPTPSTKLPTPPNQTNSPRPTTKPPKATNPHPSSPAHQPSKQRNTTIPLPRAPLRAPSPTAYAPPTPASGAPRTPPPQRPRTTRNIEPTPDLRLPAKYKPVARRLTAIMVGIPFIIVGGWELYGRWRKEVGRKFGEREVEGKGL